MQWSGIQEEVWVLWPMIAVSVPRFSGLPRFRRIDRRARLSLLFEGLDLLLLDFLLCESGLSGTVVRIDCRLSFEELLLFGCHMLEACIVFAVRFRFGQEHHLFLGYRSLIRSNLETMMVFLF